VGFVYIKVGIVRWYALPFSAEEGRGRCLGRCGGVVEEGNEELIVERYCMVSSVLRTTERLECCSEG
jgi:hypothetical protein